MVETPAASAAQSPDPALAAFFAQAGLVAQGEPTLLTPLTGGVASDIWKVTRATACSSSRRRWPELRVAKEWNAPVSRNASEVEWMRVGGDVAPDAVPRILAHDRALGVFAMTFLDPARYPVWKAELRAGRADPGLRRAAGRGPWRAIHSATAGSEELARRFANDATFHPSALEPYLEATARAHPDLGDAAVRAVARDYACNKATLVHGDVSPKNILVGPDGPVFLDAECAWYGDPAFDLAFCLNHLLLKCLWTPTPRRGFLDCFDALRGAYLVGVDWETVGRTRGARRALAAGAAARPHRRQVAGRIHHRRRAKRIACVASRAPFACAAGAARRKSATPGPGNRDHDRYDDRRGPRPAHLGFARPADGRGRGRRWAAAPAAARSRPPAPRTGSRRSRRSARRRRGVRRLRCPPRGRLGERRDRAAL